MFVMSLRLLTEGDRLTITRKNIISKENLFISLITCHFHFISEGKLWRVEDWTVPQQLLVPRDRRGVVVHHDLHEPCPNMHWYSHYDALGHSSYRVLLTVVSGVKQMVGSLLKAGQHQHRLLHLGKTVTGYPQNLPPAGHQVRQQHNVSDVDAHTVRLHGVLHLVHDGCSSRLNAQSVGDF